MNFLIDRCAGRRLADYLRELGHDVVESRELGPDPGDAALLAIAFEQSRVLITIDTDFGALLYLNKLPHAGLIRLPDVPAERRIELVQLVLDRHSQDLELGFVITVRGGRIRISRPGPKPK